MDKTGFGTRSTIPVVLVSGSRTDIPPVPGLSSIRNLFVTSDTRNGSDRLPSYSPY